MFEDKIKILGTISLINYLKKHSPKSVGVPKQDMFRKAHKVIRKTFKNFLFQNDLHSIEFRNVKFVNCDFLGVLGFYCIFKNCEFQDCGFRNCRFSHLEENWNGLYFHKCYFRTVELDEGSVFNLTFHNSSLTNCSLSGLNPSENIRFYECNIEDSRFEGFNYYDRNVPILRDDEYIDLLFQECILSSSSFYSLNFRNSRFNNTILYKSGFIDCEFDRESIILTKELKYSSYATMDFQTILRSEEFDYKILSEYFNIKTPANLKKLISSMTIPVIFSTVFISYSFKDSDFANKINDLLIKEGIRTFLWQKDAPGGKTLEEIMSSNVSGHDKLLFIASEHSIRSKACQYELTTARKKQEQLWENIFFPIIIDDYLFKVKKTQIRPIELANEYWENIEEIKRVNALDFSSFKNKPYNEEDFQNLFRKIVDGLKVVS